MAYKPGKCSYTPSANINPLNVGGKGAGKASFDNPPSVEANGSVEGACPAIPAVFSIGEDKNVSTPVSE